MGGKQKAQRTKGNVKPSSSGRSAALLSTAAISGFPGLKDSMFPSFQSASVSEEFDANIDPNFQLVLKKMSKKDPTTRVKALQEFVTLVGSSETEVLKAVLPYWPRLFCLLVGDVEHRVREVANDAQRCVILQAKRNMAPYLRSLAGPWFIAQFDTYPPAASAAVRAFHEAFPPNKLMEVIAFCQEDILKCISDNLLDQASVKQDKSERSEKQERVIITSLQGFCHYIRLVHDDLLMKPHFIQVTEALLQAQQFWRFGIDKVPLVRSAWLSVMTALLEKIPHVLKDHHQLTVKRILGRLDEADVVVIPYVWQATLSLIVKLDDWSSFCDIKKQVLPRLWNILREAGYGCAATIFPNMLPLLSSLLESKELTSDKEMIVDSFFKSLQDGFDKKTVQQSKSECEAVAQCYIECLRYVGKCDLINCKLVGEHLISVIELTFTESKLSLLSRVMFENISHLLRYWCGDKCVSQYEDVCKYFWDTLLSLFEKILLQASNDSTKSYILNQEVLFCLVMIDPVKFKNKNVHRVRFTTEEESRVLIVPEKNSNCNALGESETYMKFLRTFIMSVSLIYLTRINENHDLCCVIPLAKLLSEFDSHELIEHLISNCNVSELFCTISKKCFASSGQYIVIVVELACSMIQHLEPAEREEILNTMCQDPDALVCIFQAAQKEKVKPYILEWLQSPYLNNQLMTLTHDLASANASSSIKAVLMECAARTSNGAFIVDVHTISSILSELCNTSSDLEIAIFSAQFLTNLQVSISKVDIKLSRIKFEELAKNTYRLIAVLFNLCCDKGNEYVSDKEIIFTGWQKGVHILSKIEPADVTMLVTELSGFIRQKLQTNNISSIEDVENLVETSVKLIWATDAADIAEIYSIFVNGVLADCELLERQLTAHCGSILTLLGVPAIASRIEVSSLTPEEIIQYILLSLFSSILITKIMLLDSEALNEDDEEKQSPSQKNQFDFLDMFDSNHDLVPDEELDQLNNCQSSSCEEKSDELKNYDFIEERVIQLAFAMSACEIYTTFFKNMSFYNKAGLFINEAQNKFTLIKSAFCKSGRITSIWKSALEKARLYGGVWVPTVYNLSREDDWLSVYQFLCESDYAEYSAKVFFMKACETHNEISIDCLEDSTYIMDKAFWLKYMPVSPSTTVLSMIMKPISKWISEDRKERLYDCDVSRKSVIEVEKIVKEIYFLSACVRKCPLILEQPVWDFIIISAAYYVQNLKHLQKFYFNNEGTDFILLAPNLECNKLRNASVFSVAVFDLLTSITDFCECVKNKELTGDHNLEDRVNEWDNVFAGDVNAILINIFISASGCLDSEKPSFLGHLFLQKFCLLVMKMDENAIIRDSLKQQEGKLLTACCKLLHVSVSSLQISSYYIFKINLKHLVGKDASALTSSQNLEEETESDVLKFEIYPLLKALQNTQSVVNTLLAEFSFGDSCIIQPHTDSYYYTAAYLLLWNLILEACGFASSELRYQYASLLRNEGHLSSLLNNLFVLMPSEVLEASLPRTKSTALAALFTEAPQLSMIKECTSQQLQHWACWVYYCAVSRLPALVRQWWGDTKTKVSSIVQKATVQYVTPLLCMRDLQAIQSQKTKWKNMEVKVHSKARQVVAIYTVDEAQMELIITLPEEYPLATIQVDSHTSSLVGTSQWRNWVKQLSIFLTHQNGSLWDGLLLWKSNLDKRFEGVEECYICFSILHGTNFQIPKLCCKTCKKKFHSPCLYKWFSTSNKSTCPICRNMF